MISFGKPKVLIRARRARAEAKKIEARVRTIDLIKSRERKIARAARLIAKMNRRFCQKATSFALNAAGVQDRNVRASVQKLMQNTENFSQSQIALISLETACNLIKKTGGNKDAFLDAFRKNIAQLDRELNK